ncbi:unnamed protein product [Pleuronectes platessa]|uniref:Uncharacterized protein n=1 Tax=Pleuronectes platessa TaxID=8262 RepID=A0A9N7TYN3_PLEPL|nr:unnamed protein product [Pleuronectes platessa]
MRTSQQEEVLCSPLGNWSRRLLECEAVESSACDRAGRQQVGGAAGRSTSKQHLSQCGQEEPLVRRGPVSRRSWKAPSAPDDPVTERLEMTEHCELIPDLSTPPG